MNKLLRLLMPRRARMIRVYDALETGILLCETMEDTYSISWRVYKDMEPLRSVRGWRKYYERLWKLLEMQREHLMRKPQTIKGAY